MSSKKPVSQMLPLVNINYVFKHPCSVLISLIGTKTTVGVQDKTHQLTHHITSNRVLMLRDCCVRETVTWVDGLD